MFRLLLLLLALSACGVASATARDDGFDARPHSLVTTRGTPVRATVWSSRNAPITFAIPDKAGAARMPPAPTPPAPWPPRPKPPTVPLPPAEPVVRVVVQPRHGSAHVSGHAVVYTPATGFSGRDQLTYSLTGNGRTTSAVITVDVGDALRLRGTVVERGANASVTAIVGSHTFGTVADANGNYAIDIIGRHGDMVGLETRAGHVVLGSVVGGFARLQAEAGADAVLVAGENNLVHVSGLSTALSVLLQRANNGKPLVSDPTLQRLMGEYDAGTLLDMAGAVRLVADGGQPLPAGITDTRALLSDSAAFDQFVASLPGGLLGDAVGALEADPALFAPVSAADVPGGRTFLLPARGAQPRLGVHQGWRMVLTAGGRGHWHALNRTRDDAVRWSITGGTLRMDLDRPQQWQPAATAWIDGREVRAVSEIERIELRRVLHGGSSGRDLATVRVVGRIRYPDDPAIPDTPIDFTNFQLLHLDGVGDLPFRVAEVPGERTLPRHLVVTPNPAPGLGDLDDGNGYALHRFNPDGSGIVPGEGTAFGWSLEADGTVLMHFANGDRVRLRRVSKDGRKGEGVVATFLFADGTVKSKFDVSAVRDGSLAFVPGELAHAWRSAFQATEPRFEAWTDFHVLLDGPARTGYTRLRAPGNPPRDRPLSWSIDGDAMVARHYRDWTGERATCTPGVAGCFLASIRRWIPVAASGDRIYVIEELWNEADWTNARGVILTSQRGNFYERVPHPGP